MTLLGAFLIGVFAGLRSFTPPAVTAWAAYLGWLKLQATIALMMGTIVSVVVWTLLAVVELLVDKSPKMANRTSGRGISARILTGGLTGTCIAMSGGESLVLGAVLGSAGGIAGCFAGFHARKRLVQALRARDLYIAVIEDLIAIGGSIWVVSRFA
jgi:uncharacterized membrane protein